MKISRFIILTACVASTLTFMGCSSDEPVSSNKYASSKSTTNVVNTPKPDLFSKLEISNVSVSKESNGWYSIKGSIKNNHSKTIGGYFKVVLYDANGGIIESVTMPMPGSGGLGAGQTNVFSKSVTKVPFTKYVFMDDILGEK